MKLVLILLFLFLAPRAVADQESLSFRYAASGEIEAVISGVTSIDLFCQSEVLKPFQIDIQADQINIQSLITITPCSIPIATRTRKYQVVANLGQLPGRSYRVQWSFPTQTLSAQLDPAGLATPVNTTTKQGIVICAFLVLCFAAFRLKSRHVT
jgi:hypothetical protein